MIIICRIKVQRRITFFALSSKPCKYIRVNTASVYIKTRTVIKIIKMKLKLNERMEVMAIFLWFFVQVELHTYHMNEKFFGCSFYNLFI